MRAPPEPGALGVLAGRLAGVASLIEDISLTLRATGDTATDIGEGVLKVRDDPGLALRTIAVYIRTSVDELDLLIARLERIVRQMRALSHDVRIES